MTKDELSELEKKVMEEVVKCRKLGGYSAEAGTIMLLTEWMYEIVQHLRAAAPKK